MIYYIIPFEYTNPVIPEDEYAVSVNHLEGNLLTDDSVKYYLDAQHCYIFIAFPV